MSSGTDGMQYSFYPLPTHQNPQLLEILPALLHYSPRPLRLLRIPQIPPMQLPYQQHGASDMKSKHREYSIIEFSMHFFIITR